MSKMRRSANLLAHLLRSFGVNEELLFVGFMCKS